MKLLNFKLENSNICYLNTYNQCQKGIKSKVSLLTRQKKEVNKLKTGIKSSVSMFDFAQV